MTTSSPRAAPARRRCRAGVRAACAVCRAGSRPARADRYRARARPPAGAAQAVLVTGLRDDRTETPEDYAVEIAAGCGAACRCSAPTPISWSTAATNGSGAPAPSRATIRGEGRLGRSGTASRIGRSTSAASRCWSSLPGGPVPRRADARGRRRHRHGRQGRHPGRARRLLRHRAGWRRPSWGRIPRTPDPARLEAFLAEQARRSALRDRTGCASLLCPPSLLERNDLAQVCCARARTRLCCCAADRQERHAGQHGFSSAARSASRISRSA